MNLTVIHQQLCICTIYHSVLTSPAFSDPYSSAPNYPASGSVMYVYLPMMALAGAVETEPCQSYSRTVGHHDHPLSPLAVQSSHLYASLRLCHCALRLLRLPHRRSWLCPAAGL